MKVTEITNGKVRCVGYKGSERYFTIGKIYEVKNNTITSDIGHVYDDWKPSVISFLNGWYTFEIVNEPTPKIVITTDGKTTTARLYEDNKVVKTAEAKCSPEDTFDFKIGAKLAFERLTQEEPPKPKYYNGKVICTSNKFNPSQTIEGFTVGKIYEIIDGVITADDGWKSQQYKTLHMMCVCLGNTFIPLVE